MMSDSSAANGDAAKSKDSIQQSLRAAALIRTETFTMMRLVYFFKFFKPIAKSYCFIFRIMISSSILIRSLNTEKKLGKKWNTR